MPTDSNLDGLVDEWSISAAFPLQSNEVVNSVRLTAFFQVETNVRLQVPLPTPVATQTTRHAPLSKQDVARIRTDGFLTMDVSGTSGGTGATAYGSVAFDQAARIPSTGGYLLPELGAAILDLDTISSVRELEPVALLRRSSQRNCTCTVCCRSGADFGANRPPPRATADTISFQTVGSAAWQAETGYKPVLPAAASSSGAQGLPSTPRSFTATMQARVKTVPLWYVTESGFFTRRAVKLRPRAPQGSSTTVPSAQGGAGAVPGLVVPHLHGRTLHQRACITALRLLPAVHQAASSPTQSFLYGERILFATRRDDLPGGRKAHMS